MQVTSDSLIISVDFSDGVDANTLTVGRMRSGRIDIVNVLYGEEAINLYKLTVTTKTGIDDLLLEKIEKLFGFPLYYWQREYLKGRDSAFPLGGRCNGKTFAYCLRLLLAKGISLDLSTSAHSRQYVDEHHGQEYDRYFYRYICDLNRRLIQAGFETNAK